MVSLRDSVTVLHVADEPRRSSRVAAHLEREAADVNLTVVSTDRPSEALSRIEDESSPVDCVVGDYETPGMDGLSFLRSVRAARPNLPFVLHTGTGSEAVARDAFRVGATDYVREDAGTEQYAVLANRVLNAVSRHRAQAESRRHGTAFEALDAASCVLDGSGRFAAVDDAFVELVGHDRETLLGEARLRTRPRGRRGRLLGASRPRRLRGRRRNGSVRGGRPLGRPRANPVRRDDGPAPPRRHRNAPRR